MRQIHILTHYGKIVGAYSNAPAARKARDIQRAKHTPYYDPDKPYSDHMQRVTEEFQSWNIETHEIKGRAATEETTHG